MWHASSCAPYHAEHALPLFESIAGHGVSRRALRTALLTPAPASRQSRVSSVPAFPCHSAVRCTKSISPISPTCCATGLRARSMRPASCRCMGCEEVWGAPLVLSGCGGVYEPVVYATSFPPSHTNSDYARRTAPLARGGHLAARPEAPWKLSVGTRPPPSHRRVPAGAHALAWPTRFLRPLQGLPL